MIISDKEKHKKLLFSLLFNK